MTTSSSAARGWASMRIGAQLGWAFAVVLLLTAALGAFSTYALNHVNLVSKELAVKWLPAVRELSQARIAMLETREFESKLARAPDASYMDEYAEKMTAAVADVAKNLKSFQTLMQSPEEQGAAAALSKAWSDYLGVNAKIVSLVRADKQEDARDIGDGAGKMAADDAIGALDRLSTAQFEGGNKGAEQAEAVYVKAFALVLALVGTSLVIGLALAVLITRSLLRQLGGEPAAAAEVVNAVAAGNLDTRITLNDGDSTSLMAGLMHMQDSLAKVVQSVRQGSEMVATASAEIAIGNNDLSTRTEQQANALQQTASSMEQLGSTVSQNAANARQADALARSASEVAQRGGAAVGDVVGTMREINESSKKIADITGVIDGIAFQTNILALNAAVEAARAGEQGRGFAVVATEVRALAQRSADAARQIKSLIATSVDRVEHGSRQVDEAGVTMAEVVSSIQRVTQIMNEISAASAEQSDGVRLVGDAVARMDQTTQQNAALVEQSAAAADGLKQQARELVEAVAVFRF